MGAYRAFDFNQVNISANGFLADFLRAQNNGFLALAGDAAAFNPSLQSQHSRQPAAHGLSAARSARCHLTDPDVINYIETGQAGRAGQLLSDQWLQRQRCNFFANPYALGADMLTNYSSSSYNSLQLEARHRTRIGLSFEANYTFCKVLSDGDGDVQSRFQAFLDINNPQLERSRANFDLTHMIKADGFYELPIGKGHRLALPAARSRDRRLDCWAA